MNYMDSLEGELAAAGIPARRRARIVAEFSGHLHENPDAELGAPRAPMMLVCFISAQVALASGGLARCCGP